MSAKRVRGNLSTLEVAEVQFKFAFAISNLVGSPDRLRIPYFKVFSWGKHILDRKDLELTPEQEDIAVAAFRHSATYLCMLEVDAVLAGMFPDRFRYWDERIRSASWIARLIRNAFAHDPFAPIWKLYPECENRVYEVPNVIRLDTTGLHGQPLRREDFGGPLAILKLLWFTKDLVLDRDSSKTIQPT